jgi:hypothetical protein
METIQILSITLTLIFLGIIFRLVAKKKLREEFSLIWIFCAIFLNVFAFWRKGIEVLAEFFGVYYPPSIIYLVLFLAIILYCLHLSILLSRQREQIKNLTQDMAIMNSYLQQTKTTATP